MLATFLRISVFFLIFTNPWFWKIYKENFIFAVIITLLTLLFYLTLIRINSKSIPFRWIDYKTIILYFITLLLFFLISKEGFYKQVNQKNISERNVFLKRHLYYAVELGPIYINKYSLIFYNFFNLPINKYIHNVFDNLDPNLYFFTTHPRERAGINEFDKFPVILYPFFLIGLLFFFIKISSFKLPLIYIILVTLLSGLLDPNYKLGPILFFPIIISFIIKGIKLLMRKFYFISL